MSDEQPVTPEGQIEPLALREQLLPFLDPDTGLAGAAVDWLQERQISLADLLKAYAGNPPGWLGATWQEDEALREVLALWCQWTQPGTPAPPDPREHDGDVTLIPRYEMVRLCEPGLSAIVDAINQRGYPPHPVSLQDIEQVLRPGAEPYPYVRAAIDRARRQQKRQVLTLFPDVQYRRLLRFGLPRFGLSRSQEEMRYLMDEAEARLRADGWRVDAGITCTHDEDRKEIRYEQVLAAPDWIGPEPETIAGYPVEFVSSAEWEHGGRSASNPRLHLPAEPPPAHPA